MRMLIHLWVGLTCVLGIYGDDMVRRAAEGSGGAQMQGSGLPIAPDDEDYASSSSFTASSFSDSDYEASGGAEYSQSESYSDASDMTPSEDYTQTPPRIVDTNVVKVKGEFTIDGIGGGKLEWMEGLADRNSATFTEFSNLISPIIKRALESKKSTRNGLQSVNILGFRHGSIIAEYEAVYSPDSSVTGEQVRKSLKDAVSNQNFGRLEVNPKSVSHTTFIQPQPQGVVVTNEPPVTTNRPVTTTIKAPTRFTDKTKIREREKPQIERERERERPDTEIHVPDRSRVTDPPKAPTTQANNAIGDKDTNKPKPDNKPDNEVGGVIDIDETPEPNMEDNDTPNQVGETDGHDGVKTKEEANMSFWDKLFSHPLILAGLVGAVVIALLTVVLLLMFIVYRLKKKDEGSYSLDEPHKVKDPMAYWKDTKEFYA